jgi:hypothetical protein
MYLIEMQDQITIRAFRVFNLSLKRAKHQCPQWARTSKMRRKFLKIYRKAAIKNRFRFAYGKDGEFFHVDHITPLHGELVSGLHVPWNLKVVPATVNIAKSNKIVEDWRPYTGFGLGMKWADDL